MPPDTSCPVTPRYIVKRQRGDGDGDGDATEGRRGWASFSRASEKGSPPTSPSPKPRLARRRWKAMLLAQRTSSSFPRRRGGRGGRGGRSKTVSSVWTITVPRSLYTHSRSPKSSLVRSFTSCYSRGVYFFVLLSYFSPLFISFRLRLSFSFPLL